MEFERLSRRELQALCKKNKIPANITNVAMINALKYLEIVEGIEEFLQASQSQTAESSIESSEKLEVTSPPVPRTGERTTSRRNVAKNNPVTLQAVTRSQRTTRKTVANDVDEAKADTTETPVVVQTTRRRAPATSVCRKMDSQLKECVDEETKDVLVTPAPSGVTARRRRGLKEESVVKRVYSTRRSARLAAKSVELPVEVENEKSDFVNKDLFTIDCDESVKMNLKEGSDDLDEISRTTGGLEAKVEGKLEEKGEIEVVSEEHVQIGEESGLTDTSVEEKGHFETDGLKLQEKIVLIESVSAHANTNFEDKDESRVLSIEEQDIEVDGSNLEVKEEKDLENVNANLEEKDGSQVLSTEEQDMKVGDKSELVITVEEKMGPDFEVDDPKAEVKENKDFEKSCFGFETETEASGNGFEVDNPKIEVKEDEHLGNEKPFFGFETKTEASVFEVDGPISEVKEDKENENPCFNLETETEASGNVFEVDDFISEVNQNNEIEEPCFDLETGTEEDDKKCDQLEVPNGESLVMPLLNGISEVKEDNENEEPCFDFETGIEEDDEKCDQLEVRNGESLVVMPSNNNGQERDVFQDVDIYETEIAIESTEYLITANDVGSEDKASDSVETVVLESEDVPVVDVTEKESKLDESSNSPILEAKEEVSDNIDQVSDDTKTDVPSHISLVSKEDEARIESKAPIFVDIAVADHIQTCETPIKNSASKTPFVMKKRMADVIFSDNKENIGSGSKLVFTKEKVKITKNIAVNVTESLDEFSVRKLSKMLKEKLQITMNKMPKIDNGSEPRARLALQAVLENRSVDEQPQNSNL